METLQRFACPGQTFPGAELLGRAPELTVYHGFTFRLELSYIRLTFAASPQVSNMFFDLHAFVRLSIGKNTANFQTNNL